MGMCKSCGDVFGSTEMKNGLCKTCFSPEKVAEEEKIILEKSINKRPLGVAIVSLLQLLGAFLLITIGIFALSSSGMVGSREAGFLIIIGLVMLFVGLGIRKGKVLARTIYTILAVISIITTLVLAADRVLLGKDILNMFISIVFIGLLFIPSSNKFFEKNGMISKN